METDILSRIQNASFGPKNSLLNKILHKYKERYDKIFLKTAIYHLNVVQMYLKLIEEKGKAAFTNRREYQKFQVAKFFIDKLSLLEFSVHPSLKGFKEYKDMKSPLVNSFHEIPDLKEANMIKFCRNIDQGDILQLKVMEESETQYKLLVINKYNENETVVDYSLHAYMMKYLLDNLPKVLGVSDYIRAVVSEKIKMEGNVFSKLLVTLNEKLVHEKYKDVELGLITESDLPSFAESMTHCNSFFNYLKTDKTYDGSGEVLKIMTSLGIDPYKIYSFHEASDGRKLGQLKEVDASAKVLEAMEKSTDLVKTAEKRILTGADFESVFKILEEALKIYPKNDAAYAVRGQLHKTLFFARRSHSLTLALQDFETALNLNAYNIIATREYLTILLMSADVYKEEGNKEKVSEIKQVLEQCKGVFDLTQVMSLECNHERKK